MNVATESLLYKKPRQLEREFIEGLDRGRDWLSLHDVIKAAIVKGAFRASTVERFLVFALRTEAARTSLRQALVTERSWKRRKAHAPLSTAEVERMTRVADTVREARRLWNDDDAAEMFLTRPHPRLGGGRPIDVAVSEGGYQAVRELLTRIEEGAPV